VNLFRFRCTGVPNESINGIMIARLRRLRGTMRKSLSVLVTALPSSIGKHINWTTFTKCGMKEMALVKKKGDRFPDVPGITLLIFS
jgi:hypothetical protein